MLENKEKADAIKGSDGSEEKINAVAGLQARQLRDRPDQHNQPFDENLAANVRREIELQLSAAKMKQQESPSLILAKVIADNIGSFMMYSFIISYLFFTYKISH